MVSDKPGAIHTIRGHLPSGDLEGVRIDGQWRLSWQDVLAGRQNRSRIDRRLDRGPPYEQELPLHRQRGIAMSDIKHGSKT
jgi:hypothetical protein